MNHRSDEFMTLVQNAKKVLKKNLAIPKDYEIIFTSSATECWEIFGQSMVSGSVQSFYNGAFGEKWADYMDKLGVDVVREPFSIQESCPVNKIDSKSEWICITANETSNGTFLNKDVYRKIKENSPEKLIAIDATSAMAGLALDFKKGDFWFASVQKCFGLPPGLGVLIVSPRSIEKANEIKEDNHYNSFLNLLRNTQNNQTHYTPNITSIYCLYRTQKKVGLTSDVESKLGERFDHWSSFVENQEGLDWLIDKPELRSPTVLTLKCNEPERLQEEMKHHGLILGKGYGPWKADTIRIANFPAIRKKEIRYLMHALKTHGNF